MAHDIASSLAHRVRHRPGDPFTTYVNASTNERTELSASSLANAASKIGGALIDEFDLGPGDRVGIALPAHWQFTNWCMGIWLAGLIASPDTGDADLVVTSPARAASHTTPATEAGSRSRAHLGLQVVSMHPFGLPITERLPQHAEDVTLPVRRQPDAFLHSPGTAQDVALTADGMSYTQSQLLDAAADLARSWGVSDGGRVLVEVESMDDCTSLEAFCSLAVVPLVANASVIIVADAAAHAVNTIAEQERVSSSVRLSP